MKIHHAYKSPRRFEKQRRKSEQERLFLNRQLLVSIVLTFALVPTTAFGQYGVAEQDVVAMYLFHGSDEATYKRQLEHRNELRIRRLADELELDEKQREKLELAVNGDFSRFYREIATVREQTKDLKMNQRDDQQKAWQAVMPLQKRIAQGILGDGSLFERVLHTTLSPEQREKYDAIVRQRQLTQFRSIFRATVSDMEKSLPLTSEQRDKLIKLVESKGFPSSVTYNYDSFVGYAMLTRVSDMEVSDILDAPQQKVFMALQKQYAGYVNGFRW